MNIDLKAKDFLMYFLDKEYANKSQVLNNLVYHIERLHKDYILSNIERTRYLKHTNDLSNILNQYYNSRISTIKGAKTKKIIDYDNFNIDDEKQLENIKLQKITGVDKKLSELLKIKKEHHLNSLTTDNDVLEELYNMSFDVYNKELKKYCPNDFDVFDNKLQDLICAKGKDDGKNNCVGCRNLFDVLSIFVKNTDKFIKSDLADVNDLFVVLNKIFVPIGIEKVKKDNKNKLQIIKQTVTLEKYSHLLGNYYKIELNIPGNKDFKQIHIFGFFENDCINSFLRNSQMSNDHVHDKLALFQNICSGETKITKYHQKISAVDNNFKELYVKNMSIGELIGFDSTTFINEILNDYAYYQKYSSVGEFKTVFSDFISADLPGKFKIIKYLLLGSNGGSAGLLFGITKDSKSGSMIIADIIYKSLNLPLQLKLHKESITIKSEEERLNALDTDDIDMKKQIMLNKNMPPRVKKLALEKLNEAKAGGSEYSKHLTYAKAIVEYPWIGEHDGDMFMQYRTPDKWREIISSSEEKLEQKVYGHKECKETISELITKWFTNPKSLGKSLALCGPPGVGKTMIAMELGKSLGLPFAKINLAGVDDNSILIGHSITYSGATYGLIIKKMTETKASRCIMFFDELDKAAKHHGRNEIFDVLMHVTDSTTNSQFNDKFFQDLSFPLNKVLFVFSFNEIKKIDPILLDRMEVINVVPYSVEDKVNIAKRYLMKEVKTDMGLDDYTIIMSDINIIFVVESYTQEAGVRSLRRKIEKILQKFNKDRVFQRGIFEHTDGKDIEITKDSIIKYLGKPPKLEETIHHASEAGLINALYATDGGDGGIIPIILYKNQAGNSKKFLLKITGNPKKIMKDSISLAFTVATNLVKPKYVKNFFKKYKNGFHIHSGDLSTSKDGPSATVSFTVAFISKILNIKIKNIVGLTGEVQGDARVTKIGGLHYKLQGAKRAGIQLVFAPKDNEEDYNKIKDTDSNLFNDNFKVILVENVKDVLEYALIDVDEDNEDMTFAKTFECDKYILGSCIRQPNSCSDFDVEIDDEQICESDSDENNSQSVDEDSHSDSECESDSGRSK
jgi:ATP-dependent Lon protease